MADGEPAWNENHPTLDEFVERLVREAGISEAQALEQWRCRIGRLGEHAFVECEDAQLTIEQRVIHIERAKDMGLA